MNVKKLLLFILSLFFINYLISEEIITTKDGRKILLKDDFTWEYVESTDIPQKNLSIESKQQKESIQKKNTSSKGSKYVSISDIYDNPEKYDQKYVMLKGRVTSVRFKTSRRGNNYTTFYLEDDTGRIKVFSWGFAAIADGDNVSVYGKYYIMKRVGNYRFPNEVDAIRIDKIKE